MILIDSSLESIETIKKYAEYLAILCDRIIDKTNDFNNTNLLKNKETPPDKDNVEIFEHSSIMQDLLLMQLSSKISLTISDYTKNPQIHCIL